MENPAQLARQDREQRLNRAIREYLAARKAGRPADRQKFLARHPGLEKDLRAFFDQEDEREAATTSFEPLPSSIGRFKVLGLVGVGAFGFVYRAHDPKLDRDVAIKMPRLQGANAEEALGRFEREARLAAKLRHPNICTVHETGTHEGRLYIVMDFVPGESLAEHLEHRKEAMPPRQAALLVRKLALALHEAHRKGIIHRDLKPSNVLIDRERRDVVVTDFGLARHTRFGDGGLTREGQFLGTPAYCSPEQARGDQAGVGPATDVYSLGAIFYELLTGKHPFQGSLPQLLAQIVTQEPEPPSKLRPDLDPPLEAICLRALAKEPGDRYPSMQAFADALGKYLGRPADAASQSDRVVGLLETLRADRQTDTEQIVRATLSRYRVKPWMWLCASGFSIALVLLAVLPFLRPATVHVMIRIDEKLDDTSLSFWLDGKPVSGDELRSPIELTIGEHELLVKRADVLLRRYHFRVGRGENSVEPSPELVAPPPARLRLLVPAYFYPAGPDLKSWDRLIASAGKADIVVIVNVRSGPADAVNLDYQKVIRRAHQAGLKLIGYVVTNYARPDRPLPKVQADIDRWFQFYPEIDGIFFDQQLGDVRGVAYYEAAAEHVRQLRRDALIIGNPGAWCDRRYLNPRAMQSVCVSQAAGDLPIQLPDWTEPSDRPRLGVIRFGVSDAATMRTIVTRCQALHVGYVNVTDRPATINAWAGLPGWWEEELNAVANANQSRGP